MQWRAFDSLEPIGGPATDFRFGVLARSVLAAAGGTDLPHPLEFFPWNDDEITIISPEELCRMSERGMM